MPVVWTWVCRTWVVTPHQHLHGDGLVRSAPCGRGWSSSALFHTFLLQGDPVLTGRHASWVPAQKGLGIWISFNKWPR